MKLPNIEYVYMVPKQRKEAKAVFNVQKAILKKEQLSSID
jgi:hypothetical protein